MLQVGHIDPLKVAFNFSGGSWVNCIPTGSIECMVLTGGPKELRADYIGQADLIS